MCGITGFITKKEYTDMSGADRIQRMMDSATYRGPDDSGMLALLFKDGKYSLAPDMRIDKAHGYLGFNRLSIQDISPNAHQPMVSGDKNIAVVFNGEIYNTEELKAKHLAHCAFNSTGDTEVILRLYERYGFDKTVTLLNGMFAIVILDTRKGRIFMARDRVGIKPLYLFHNGETVVFASEMKSVLASGFAAPRLDKIAFYETMLFSFPYKRTLIENIWELTPGTVYDMSLYDLKYETRAYFDVRKAVRTKNNLSYTEAKEELKRILQSTVRRQMITDVPLCCQLSGGVDSSLVTYEMTQVGKGIKNNNIKNMAIGVKISDPALSEEYWIKRAASVCDCQLSMVNLTDEAALTDWPDAIYHMDCIPSMTSEIGVMELAKRAKEENITVLLSGEGADELFAGYNRFNLAPTENTSGEDILLYSGDGVGRELLKELFPSMGEVMEEITKSRLEVIQSLMAMDIPFTDVMRCYEILVRLPAVLLRQDKMTMASSVENRVPLLDNEVIDFALSLPAEYLFGKDDKGNVQGKYILKDYAADYFGREFVFRPKIGFSMPVSNFLKQLKETNRFKPLFLSVESDSRTDKSVFDKLKQKAGIAGTFDDETVMLWRILSMKIFEEKFGL